MIRNKYVLYFFRIIVGGVFIWAGVLKIIDPLGFAQSIANYRLFPVWMAFFLALVIPWIELICGVLLILGLFPRTSSLVLSLFLFAFIVLISSAILRGLNIDCGCFGSFSQKVDYSLLLVDGMLFGMSTLLFLSSGRKKV
ncbi:MAG: MauE/DoxX family redox-associated membrane protein [Acidobacteriota bacterium]|nr:MauE/DoxX family redox-associated membrane protein [Acidobacteriota bacterium]